MTPIDTITIIIKILFPPGKHPKDERLKKKKQLCSIFLNNFSKSSIKVLKK